MIQAEVIRVGMADLQVCSGPHGILRTTGLGSCVGLTLFDPKLKIAGMAHVMLPSSEIARTGEINLAKYADTAVPELVHRMSDLGASISRLEAKLAGGAQMFSMIGSDTMRIGPRNVESCKEMLGKYAIRIKAEDTGGNYGRTIELFCDSGRLTIRSVQQGVKDI